MLPFLAFAFVMPEAIHVWEPPLANPLLWIAVGIVLWLGLRWLIDASIKVISPTTRLLVWGIMIVASAALALLIVRSV